MKFTGEQFTATLYMLMSAAAEGQVPGEEDENTKAVIAGCLAIMGNARLVRVGTEIINSALEDKP